MSNDHFHHPDKPSANDKQLVSGNAVAIDSLTNNTSDSHNVYSDSHDVSHTTVYNTTLSPQAEEARRKQEYRTFCEPFLLNGPVSENDRKSLELKAKTLNLTEFETLEIENEVKKHLCSSKRMSSIQEESLNEAINIIDSTRGNHKRALDILSSLKSKGFNNETINFYYARALALANPSAYLARFERNSRKFFSYEDTFWAFFAYKKKSENSQAQEAIQTLAESTDYPEENAGLLLICDKLYDEISKPGTYNIRNIRDGLHKYTGVSHNVEPLFETVEYILDNLDGSYVPLSNDERVNSYLSFFPIKKVHPTFRVIFALCKEKRRNLKYSSSRYP